MEKDYSPARSWRFCLVLAGCAILSLSCSRADDYGPNIFPWGNFSNVLTTYVPWAGVDNKGNIHGLEARQVAVGEDGGIRLSHFGPSIAVGDLNGDGKPDIVMADSEGFFWYFPNSGTPQNPAFTQGEVIPIWLGRQLTATVREGIVNVVPRIQLVDLDGSKKLSIVAGTYMGSLYNIPNIGSLTAPNFKPTVDRERLEIPTHRQGVLWCNYLSPFMTTAFGPGNTWDLVMGDGTYSANSIYLLHSTSTGERPSYDEDHIQKIIPGMGLEQLTPAVVDWNNDGKPDIICGTRTGEINLFLNNSSAPSNPTFGPPTPITIGGAEKLGGSVTVAIGDLTGNHLPNLLIGKDDGTVLYALNTGTLGNPQFTTPATPLKGVLPPTYHYTSLLSWTKSGAWGAPDELLGAVNPQSEPGFTFPDGEKTTYAMKFWVWPVTNTYFPVRYYPPVEDWFMEHIIKCNQGVTLQVNTRYRIHLWVKSDNPVKEFRYRLVPGGGWGQVGKGLFHPQDIINPINCGPSWTEITSELEIPNEVDPSIKSWNYGFEFRFQGQSTFYVDDVQIQQELN